MDPKTTGVHEPYVVESKPGDETLTPEKRHSITGDVFVHDHGAETDLRRILSTRHLTMIALGSSIGMGLWLGSGTSLVDGGPAGKISHVEEFWNVLLNIAF
jgi:amino acid permease